MHPENDIDIDGEDIYRFQYDTVPFHIQLMKQSIYYEIGLVNDILINGSGNWY